MTRAVAYRLQEIAYGGASKVTQRRLMTLAAEFETRGTIAPPSGPKIKPGSRLVREWHGRTGLVHHAEAVIGVVDLGEPHLEVAGGLLGLVELAGTDEVGSGALSEQRQVV